MTTVRTTTRLIAIAAVLFVAQLPACDCGGNSGNNSADATVDTPTVDAPTGACGPLTCSGCCAGDQCVAGTADTACGAAGGACQPCPTGQTCSTGGTCSGCDATFCPNGCCSGPTCNASSPTTCGTAGAACVACDPATSDSCSANGCQCGNSPPCTPPLGCNNGTCVACSAATCANGCCSSTGACLQGDTAMACGTVGSACVACPSGETCNGGACSGCNATTCPNGCCSGSTCLSGMDDTACGDQGAACENCVPDGNQCQIDQSCG